MINSFAVKLSDSHTSEIASAKKKPSSAPFSSHDLELDADFTEIDALFATCDLFRLVRMLRMLRLLLRDLS